MSLRFKVVRKMVKFSTIFKEDIVLCPSDYPYLYQQNYQSLVLIGEKNVLSNICSGIFFKVENQGVCMVGKKK